MPAPATSSRHLHTGHRRGHIQPAPRLRTHRSEPLSRDHPQIPVSMPSLFRFDASAVVHTCSSSHRTPAPLQRDVNPSAHRETSTPALTTPALDRRSLRWFGISACTATPQDLPPSLAQHGSCQRSSTSSSLPFRTHVGARNSAVVVDLPRCGPMLSPRVPNLVPIPGPRMERETPGQRPRPNYGHPHAGTTLPTAASPTSAATSISRSDRPRRPTPASPLQEAPPLAQHPSGGICQRCPAIPSTDRRQLGISAHLALARSSTSPERSPAPSEARACIGSLPAARGLLSPSAGVASAHQVRHLDEPAAGPAGQSHNRSQRRIGRAIGSVADVGVGGL